MKRFLFLPALLLLVYRTMAGLPFYEPFADRTASGGTDYAIGTVLATNADGLGDIWNSLGSNFPGPQPTNVAGNLSYTNLPPSSGHSVNFVPAANQSARLNFGATIPNSTRAYYSYLLKITDLTAVPTTAANNFFAGFSDGSVAQPQQLARVGTRVLTKKSGAGYVLGLGRNNTVSDYVYDTTVYNINDTVFLVGSYDVTAGVTNVNLWINPPISTFGSNAPPPPTLTATAVSSFTGNLNNNGIAGFVIVCQNSTAPSGVIDELRIGTSWSFVTGGDPAILQNPASVTLPPGATAKLSIVARGTPTLAYSWVKDGTTVLADGGNISGAATPTLTINNVSPSDTGNYVAFVTNGLGNFAQSATATLSISDPAIIGQPQSRTDNYGATATFQVTPLGTAPFGYQWHKAGFGDLSDGGNISGSHSNILSIAGVSALDAGSYSVTVTNSLGSVDSQSADLSVNDPAILTQPTSVTNIEGSNVTFSVSAAGSGALSYQWYKNGGALVDGGNISGAATATLGISSISLADQAQYNVVVSGSLSTTSSVATLSVITPVSITAQPTSRTLPAGSKAVLAVGAGGWAPLGYQWQLEGANVPGATAAAYAIANLQAAATGNYRVIVSNVLNSVTSSVAVVAITTTPHFYQTNLILIRVGDGAQALTANGNSMSMDQFSGAGAYINSINLPDNGPSAIITMGPNVTITPNSATGTTLSRSADGRKLVVAGYNTAVGFGLALQNSSSLTVPRGVGFINSLAQYSLALASTDTHFSETYWRSAVSDGTNNFWGSARAGGTYYFGFDGPAETIQTTFGNIRSMALFNGSIYCASAVSGNNGILKLDGMPTTAAAANATLLFPGSTSTSDMEVSPDGNLIYVADDRNAPSGGIQRYDFDGANWNLSYTLTDGLPFGTRYVTADFQGPNPVVYAITKEATDDNNRIVRIEDTGAGSLGTTVAEAGANQNFRGIRFGPAETSPIARPLLSFARVGTDLILSWTGSFTLQSATNVTGPYADVPGSSSPYTNSFNSASRLFFRLRQ